MSWHGRQSERPTAAIQWRRMAYLSVIPPPQATGELAELYRACASPDGSVDESLVALSLNPPLLRADADLYRVTMYAPPGLSRAEREMIAVLVSSLNGCRRCVTHHAESLRRLLPRQRAELAGRIADGTPTASLTERERAILDLARALTLSPCSIARADLEAGRRSGLSDAELLDLVNVASYFAYANRMTFGLGIGEHAAAGDRTPTDRAPRSETTR